MFSPATFTYRKLQPGDGKGARHEALANYELKPLFAVSTTVLSSVFWPAGNLFPTGLFLNVK